MTRDKAHGPELGHQLDELYGEFHEKYTALLTDTIARHGWAIQGVLGCDGAPPYAYTIGLSEFDGHPELMVTGLQPPAAATLLNALGDQVRAGIRLRDRRQCVDLPVWPRLALLEIDPAASEDLMLFANERYQRPDGPPVTGLQVVWSDPGGVLPWEPGWSLPDETQPIVRGSLGAPDLAAYLAAAAEDERGEEEAAGAGEAGVELPETRLEDSDAHADPEIRSTDRAGDDDDSRGQSRHQHDHKPEGWHDARAGHASDTDPTATEATGIPSEDDPSAGDPKGDTAPTGAPPPDPTARPAPTAATGTAPTGRMNGTAPRIVPHPRRRRH
jgi:hypothetical protein